MKDHPSEYIELDDQPDDQDQAEVDLVWERDVAWKRTDVRRIVMTEDYEPSCCPICGDVKMHTSCDRYLGTWPERGYPHHDSD